MTTDWVRQSDDDYCNFSVLGTLTERERERETVRERERETERETQREIGAERDRERASERARNDKWTLLRRSPSARGNVE